MDDDDELARLRSLAHPLRLRMLSLLTGTPMSAAEVARELDITHANASYHLRQLLDAELLVVDGEERIRGGIAKRYRYPHERPEPKPSAEQLAGQVEAMCQELLRRITHREAESPGAFTDAELWLTPEDYAEALEHLRTASLLVHDRARRPRTPGTVKTNLTVAAFRMSP